MEPNSSWNCICNLILTLLSILGNILFPFDRLWMGSVAAPVIQANGSEPASTLGTGHSEGTLGWLGVCLCLQDTSRSAKWQRQAAVGHWVSLCVKCCRMATISILANTVRPSVDRRSDDTAFEWEHSHSKTQYIPGKQVLVRSWLWKINLF